MAQRDADDRVLTAAGVDLINGLNGSANRGPAIESWMLRSGSVLLLLLARTPPVAAQEMPAIQAVRVNGALALDGRLDDPAWEGVSRRSPTSSNRCPYRALRQPSAPRSQAVYDDEALYVGVRAFHSPGVPIVANELRRDAGRVHVRNDTFTVALDTFFDRRNGYLFTFTPLGAVADWAFWDEGRAFSQDWDAVWEVNMLVEEWGWSAEMRLPFRSLRFQKRGPHSAGAFSSDVSCSRRTSGATRP